MSSKNVVKKDNCPDMLRYTCTTLLACDWTHSLSDVFIFLNTGNTLILRAIFSNKELQTPTNLFLASLAVADLLFVIFLPIQTVSISLLYKQ